MQKTRILSIATIVAAALCAAALAAPAAEAQTYQVTITNLTKGQVFSPPIVYSHRYGFELFQPGQEAIPELAAVAEDADAEPLMALFATESGVHDVSIAADVVPPGGSITVSIDLKGNHRHVSVVGMLVTTNDAFYAHGARVSGQGTRFYAPAWDAGSENNTQDCAHIPGPPCGTPGVRVTDGAEGYVYIHQGIQDRSSLQSQNHDWRNPVAKISVRRR